MQFGASQAKKSQFFFEKGIDLDFRSDLKKNFAHNKNSKKREEFRNLFSTTLNPGSVMVSDLCLHTLTSRKTSDCKKIQITLKVG